MKRVFAYIGFSAALTQLVLCLVPMMYCEYIKIAAIWLAVIFVASLLLPAFRRAEVVPLCIGASLLTCLLFLLTLNTAVLPERKLDNTAADCTFYVTDNAYVGASDLSYDAVVTGVDVPYAVQNFKTIVSADKLTNLEPYREYTASLDFYVKYDDAFSSYGSFSDNVYIHSRLNYVKSVGDTVHSPMKYILDLREHISKTLRAYLGEYYGGLSVALITGNKSYLDYSIKSAFTNLGITHLTAVSGLHLSVITGVLFFMLKKLRLTSRLSSVFCMLLTVAYIALADFSGSVMRAGIMLIVLLAGELFEMRSDSLNSLGLAVAILCLNPYAVTDIGSVLSVLCILAVVVVYPLFGEKLRVKYVDPLNKKFSELVGERTVKLLSGFYTSVVVAAVTMPVCFVFFGTVSVFSAVANIVAIPLGSACVVFTVLFYLLSLLNIPLLSLSFASLAYACDRLLVDFVKLLNSLGNLTFFMDHRYYYVFAAIFVLLAVCVLFDSKKLLRLGAVLCVVVFLASSCLFAVTDKNTDYVYLTGSGAGVVSCDEQTVVFGVGSYSEYFSVADYLENKSAQIDVLVSDNDYYSSLISKRFSVHTLICDEFNDTILDNANKEYLIVNNAVSLNIGDSCALYFRNGRTVFDLNGFTVGNDSSADVFLSKTKAIDSHGIVLLENGDALYAVQDKNTYTLRRIYNG